jgi:hypothetical protein
MARLDIADRVDRHRTTITGCTAATRYANQTTGTRSITTSATNRLRKDASRLGTTCRNVRAVRHTYCATRTTGTRIARHAHQAAGTRTRATAAANRLRINTRGTGARCINRCADGVAAGGNVICNGKGAAIRNDIATRTSLRAATTNTYQTTSATAGATAATNRLRKDPEGVVEHCGQAAVGVHRHRSTTTRATTTGAHTHQTAGTGARTTTPANGLSKDRRRVGLTARTRNTVTSTDVSLRVHCDRATITGCATTTGNTDETTRTSTVTATTTDGLREDAPRFGTLRRDMRTIGDVNRATGATVTAPTGNPDKAAGAGT